MFPLFIVAALHLRLKEPSELSLNGPSDPVPFLYSALNYVFAVWEYVCIDPGALLDNQESDLLSHLVLLGLSALDYAPESLAAPVCALA